MAVKGLIGGIAILSGAILLFAVASHASCSTNSDCNCDHTCISDGAGGNWCGNYVGTCNNTSSSAWPCGSECSGVVTPPPTTPPPPPPSSPPPNCVTGV